MKRLVFVDDDRDELDAMEKLVRGEYEYLGLHWPKQMPNRATIGQPIPAIFVSDLYVPAPTDLVELSDFPPEVLAKQVEIANKRAAAFTQLYPGRGGAKPRMRQTMAALAQGRELLDEQWRGLGPSIARV